MAESSERTPLVTKKQGAPCTQYGPPKEGGDTSTPAGESWWSRKTAEEKRLVVGVAVLAAICLILVALVLYGFLRGGTRTEPVISGLSTEVCNTTACREKATVVLASIDESVDPCDDFYEFACQKWERNNRIPDDRSRYSSFDKLRVQLLEDLKVILEKTPHKTNEQNVSDKVAMAYYSCLNNTLSDEAQALSLKDLLASVGIAGWPLREKSPASDVWDYDCFSKLYTRTANSPVFLLRIEPDARNVTNYVLSMDQPGLGVGRYQLLNATAPQNQAIVRAYKIFIGESIKVLDPQIKQDELTGIVDSIFSFEVELAKRTRSPEERRDVTSMYHMKSIAELQAEAPGIDWLRFINSIFENVNITLDEREKVMVKEPGYVNSTVELLKTVDRATVYNYMGWRMIQDVGPSTSRRFRDLHFDFRRIVQGVQKIEPVWQKCINTLNAVAAFAVGRLYVEHKFSAQAKGDMERLVAELREAFSLLLEQNQWMDAKSKEEAFKKMETMIAHIAYPDWITDNTYLSSRYAWVGDVKPEDSFLDTYLNFTHNHVVRKLLKLHTFYNRSEEWVTSPAVVNAFYSPEANSISFPAGILHSLFYTYGLPPNINMGTIGYVIGHEITHGFDDTGSQYDDVGNLRDWWTKETRVQFTKKAQCFIDQYGSTLDTQTNMTLNGVNTQGENIADNGGIREAFRAQRIAIAKAGSLTAPALPGLEKYTSDQMFFISVAMVWCTSTRTEALKQLIQYDTHSPSKYRVNIPMGNFDEFSKAFRCPEGSRMNLKDRCVLW